MTVQELIDRLQQIEDKSKLIVVNSCDGTGVSSVVVVTNNGDDVFVTDE